MKQCKRCSKLRTNAEFRGENISCNYCLDYQAQYRKDNPEKTNMFKRQYYRRNKDKQKIYRERIIKDRPWVRIYAAIVSRCTGKNQPYYKKGIKNYLKTKDVKFLWLRDKAYCMKFAVIHRKHSDKNYTIENCKFVESVIHKKYHAEKQFGKNPKNI